MAAWALLAGCVAGIGGVSEGNAATPGAQPLDVAAAPSTVRLHGPVEVLFDRAGTRTVDDVLVRDAPFVPVGARDYTRPPEQGTVWLRVTLTNSGPLPLQRLLVLKFWLIDTVDAYLPTRSGGHARWQAGEDTPVDQRLDPLLPIFPLTIDAGQTSVIYLRLRDEGALPVPLELTTWADLFSWGRARSGINGAFLGCMLMLVLLGTYLSATLRDRTYKWFTGYLLAVLVSTSFYFWGGAGAWIPAAWRPWAVNRIIVLSALGIFWTSSRFAGYLLDLPEHMPRLASRMRWMDGVYPLLMVGAATLPYGLAVPISALALLPLLLPIGASVLRARTGDRIALIYAGSWAVVFAGISLVYLQVYSVVPKNLFTDHGIYGGLVVQFCVFCVAMAQRFKAIQGERRRALKERLAAYERNAALARVFERFVPKAFLDRLERRAITDIELGQCVEKKMTTLFSDIRSFTTLVEHMTPEENFEFINEYLGYMEPAIHQQLGFIDKYIGDAVMALFDDGGDALGRADDLGGAAQAVRAAMGMHEALDRYNDQRSSRGDGPIAIGVGLHTGQLMLGTIGGRDRLNASVIGDAVNLASRIESLTKTYGARTLLSDDTVACLPPDHGYTLRVVDRVRVKGKSEPTTLYELLDCEEPDRAALRRRTLPVYEEAWAALRRGDPGRAHELFEQVLQADPGDAAAALQLGRCDQLLSEGVPEGWDGVRALTEKP